MKDFFKVIKFASRSRGLFTATIILTLLMATISLYIPYVYKQFFDLIEQGLRSGSFESITQPLLVLSVIYWSVLGVETIFSSLTYYVSARWWYEAFNGVSADVFSRLQVLSMDFFDTHSTGKIRERTSQGTSSLIMTIDIFFRIILVRFIFMVVSVFVVFSINYVYGLLALVSIPLLIYINMKNKRTFSIYRKENRKRWEKLAAFWQDSMSNARIVRAFTKEAAHTKKMNLLLNKIKTSGLKINKKFAWIRVGRGFILDSIRVFSLSYGVFLISTNKLSLGTFTLLYTYLDRSISPIPELSSHVEEIQQKLVDTKLLFDFLEEKPTVLDKEGAVVLNNVQGDVGFKNVRYGYDKKKIIRGFNLQVKSGETVAFVGKSGVGKSTIMKLLLRYYDIREGSITVDGHDIRDVTQNSLRGNIATVFQDSYLFNDTVKNNVSYGTQKTDKKKVEEALRMANADVFVDKLKRGVNTMIGERGVKLSGGEQQRISIARAIIKDAPIIILDEATSALDSESELLIQDALYNLTKNKTTFIIAHRLSTVMRADKIVVLDKGKIVEIGTHSDLVKKKGIYAKLYDIQSGGYLA